MTPRTFRRVVEAYAEEQQRQVTERKRYTGLLMYATGNLKFADIDNLLPGWRVIPREEQFTEKNAEQALARIKRRAGIDDGQGTDG